MSLPVAFNKIQCKIIVEDKNGALSGVVDWVMKKSQCQGKMADDIALSKSEIEESE